MGDKHRVLKENLDMALPASCGLRVWVEVADAWAPERSYVQAQELGEAFGEGTFLLVPVDGDFGRAEEHRVVIAPKTYDFAVDGAVAA
jgi:hypothetical protein